MLINLGIRTILESTQEMVANVKKAQERLTRLLSIYAPGGLSDTESSHSGPMVGSLGGAILPISRSITLMARLDGESHMVSYGHDPINLPLDAKATYLGELGQEILETKDKYAKIAYVLTFMNALSGANTKLNQPSNTDLIRDVNTANHFLLKITEGVDLLGTNAGVRELTSLHNALNYLIKDMPIDALNEQIGNAGKIFYDLIAKHHNIAVRADIRSGYQMDLWARENLSDVADLLPTGQELFGKDGVPLLTCES